MDNQIIDEISKQKVMRFKDEKRYRVHWKREFGESVKNYHANGFPRFLGEYKDSHERIPALISFDTLDETINFIANLYDRCIYLLEDDLCVVDDSGLPFGVTPREQWLSEGEIEKLTRVK